MNDEVKVDNLDAKILKNTKFRKDHEPELATLQKCLFI